MAIPVPAMQTTPSRLSCLPDWSEAEDGGFGAWQEDGAPLDPLEQTLALGPWLSCPAAPSTLSRQSLRLDGIFVDVILGRIAVKTNPAVSFGTLLLNKCDLWISSCRCTLAGDERSGTLESVEGTENVLEGWKWGMNIPLGFKPALL